MTSLNVWSTCLPLAYVQDFRMALKENGRVIKQIATSQWKFGLKQTRCNEWQAWFAVFFRHSYGLAFFHN